MKSDLHNQVPSPLLHPPPIFLFSRRFNRDEEGGAAKWQSRRRLPSRERPRCLLVGTLSSLVKHTHAEVKGRSLLRRVGHGCQLRGEAYISPPFKYGLPCRTMTRMTSNCYVITKALNIPLHPY